jgi:hypothetical protein
MVTLRSSYFEVRCEAPGAGQFSRLGQPATITIRPNRWLYELGMV